MNRKAQSANTIRAAVESATQRNKDKAALKEVKRQEAEKMANPNLTAVIVEADSKTLKMKWVATDKLNSEIL